MDPILVETEGWKTDTMTTLGLEASEGPMKSRANYGNVLLTRHLNNMFDTLRGVTESFEGSNLVSTVLAPRILKNKGQARRLPSRSGYSAKILLGTAPTAVSFQFADLKNASSGTIEIDEALSHQKLTGDRFRVANRHPEHYVPQLKLNQHVIQRSQQNLLNFDEEKLQPSLGAPVERSAIHRQIVSRHRKAKRGLMPNSQEEVSQDQQYTRPHIPEDRSRDTEHPKQQIGTMMEEDLGLNIAGHKHMLQELAPVGNPQTPKKLAPPPIAVFKRLRRLISEDCARKPLFPRPQQPLDLSIDLSTDKKSHKHLDRDLKSWSLEQNLNKTAAAVINQETVQKEPSLHLQVKNASKIVQKTNLVRIRDLGPLGGAAGVSGSQQGSRSVDSRSSGPLFGLPLPTTNKSESTRDKHSRSAVREGMLRTAARDYRQKYRRPAPPAEGQVLLAVGGERMSAAEGRREAVGQALREVRELLGRTQCNARLGYLIDD